ncbi:hypothetical protein [Bacillus licheniformis]|uniref:hypothetical protein n=1 Tax=Bacillus licheniformis TaxID=1402 RepID=UPI000BA7DED4|nr:hypothetical protein [Bacillus licheniformis]PAD57318.1 hypothetical protein CHH97_01295 [Bacillus licheniformis]
MSKEWYLMSSNNYLSGYENEEFTSNKYQIFIEILANSPETYDVELNGKPVQVIIQTTQNSEVKKILTVIGLLNRGDIIKYDDNLWIVDSRPTDNKMNDSATMRLSNSSIKITTNDKWIDSDKISEITGKPIKIKVPGEVIEIPCVFERSTSINGTDLAVNLPNGQANITIPNIKNDKIKIGLPLSFFGEDYLVKDIDYSKVYGDHGTIKLIAEKKVRGEDSA